MTLPQQPAPSVPVMQHMPAYAQPAQPGAQGVKRQQEYIHEDLQRICNPDINRPFSSFSDAVDRLLPYHLLAAEETEEADREAAAIQSASSPPLSKYEAWQEHWRRQAATHASQLEGLARRLQEIEGERARPGRSRPEEEFYLAKLAADAEREALQKLRAEIKAAADAEVRARMEAALKERLAQDAADREKAELAAAAAAAAAAGTSAPEGAAALPAEGQPASSEPAPSALPGTQQPLPDSAAQELPTGPKVDSDAVIDSTAAMKAEALPAKAEEPEEPGGWSGWQ